MADTKIKIDGDATALERKFNAIDQEINTKLEEWDLAAEAKLTNILFSIRGLADALDLIGAVTNQAVDQQLLAMITTGISQIIQVKQQAAIFAATPGLQTLGLSMLAMLPIITGTIQKLNQDRAAQARRFKELNNKSLDDTLDGIF